MNQPPKKGVVASPDEWLKHAGSDLRLALLGKNQDILPEQVCFHAPQAIEKSFKAVLLYNNIDFPFTHDLEELIDTMENEGVSLPSELEESGILTPYAVETRYPGYWGEISKTDVTEAIELAGKAVNWAKRQISGQG